MMLRPKLLSKNVVRYSRGHNDQVDPNPPAEANFRSCSTGPRSVSRTIKTSRSLVGPISPDAYDPKT